MVHTMDEFGSLTRNDALAGEIRGEMTLHGRITFRRFMELALYHPSLGYYASEQERIGAHGDFVTSPALGPLFGAMLGRQVAEIWELLGAPEPFDIVEFGGGDGALCRALLGWAERAMPALAEALRYTIVEQGPDTSDRHPRVRRRREVSELGGGVTGVILSNELPDSFPVHRVRVMGGRLQEVYVTWAGSFVEADGPLSRPELSEYFRRLGLMPGEGASAEVNLDALTWVQGAAGLLRRGAMLTIDYGYPAADLYAPWRKQGTLMAFYHHAVVDDPYAHIGRQDLTSHVDFTTLARTGEEAGLQTLGFTSQGHFLHALGVHEAIAAEGLSLEERLARRRLALALTDPAGLGRIRVLAQGRDLPDGTVLRGFAEAPEPQTTLRRGLPGERTA